MLQPTPTTRRLLYSCAMLSLLVLTGCVSKSTAGDATTYKFQWWIPTLITLVGIGAVLLGLLFIAAGKIQNGLISGVIGLGALLFGPGMFLDKAVIDKNHFELRTGIWFSPTVHNIKWDDVTSINRTMEESRGRRNRKNTSYYANFALKSGQTEKVSLGDMMKNGPYADILRIAAERGIPVTGIGPEVN